MKIFVETPRLILREMMHSDLEGMFELDSDPEVHRYLGNNPVTDRKQSRKLIEGVREQYERNGIGRWSVVLKDTGEFIGWSGLKIETNVNGRERFYDVGYRFIRRFWGKGYGCESAQASLDYGFEKMGWKTICGAAHYENIGSQKILTKIGLEKTEEFLYDEKILCYWYEKTV